MSAKQLLMMGLPKAGKTTFLGALWHMVESNEVSCSLRLSRMEGDMSFLDQIRQRWMSATPPERTDHDVMQPVVLHLLPGDGGPAFALHVPDLAGETYRAQWHYRQRSKEQEAQANMSSGILLLVHSAVRRPMLLCEMDPILDAGPPAAVEEARRAEAGRKWEPDLSPTQVILVDLLQFAMSNRAGRLRVAVMITAWDLVPEPRPDPAAWVAAELPLLHQYLRSNPQWLEARFYGLSAQGGDYEKPEERERLTTNLLQAERVIIAGPECAPHDLTAPIQWLLR